MFELYVLVINLLYRIGYIAGTFLILLGGWALIAKITKPRAPKSIFIPLVLLAVGAAMIYGNHFYHYTQTSEYNINQNKKQRINKYKTLAKQIDFPVYKVNSSHPEVTGEMAFVDTGAYNKPPLHVVYTLLTDNENEYVDIYQYGNGFRPNTLVGAFPEGTCQENSACSAIGESEFGTVYKVNPKSPTISNAYFASNHTTSIFLEASQHFDKFSNEDSLNIFNNLQSIEPQSLPFTGN